MDDWTQPSESSVVALPVLEGLLLERAVSADPQPIALADVRTYLNRVGASDINEGYMREGWVVQLVPVAELRAMHDDFRYFPLVKGELFTAVMSRARPEIETRSFPCSDTIKERRPKPLITVIRDAEVGLYVLEGGGRTLSACLWVEPLIGAFVLDVPEEHREKV